MRSSPCAEATPYPEQVHHPQVPPYENRQPESGRSSFPIEFLNGSGGRGRVGEGGGRQESAISAVVQTPTATIASPAKSARLVFPFHQTTFVGFISSRISDRSYSFRSFPPSPALNARRLPKLLICCSIGGVRASSQCTRRMKSSSFLDGSTSLILNGKTRNTNPKGLFNLHPDCGRVVGMLREDEHHRLGLFDCCDNRLSPVLPGQHISWGNPAT